MPIEPKSPDKLVSELHNLPFSIPIGEGSFQGLKCPKHGTDRFVCKDDMEDWLKSALASTILWAAEELEKQPKAGSKPSENPLSKEQVYYCNGMRAADVLALKSLANTIAK